MGKFVAKSCFENKMIKKRRNHLELSTMKRFSVWVHWSSDPVIENIVLNICIRCGDLQCIRQSKPVIYTKWTTYLGHFYVLPVTKSGLEKLQELAVLLMIERLKLVWNQNSLHWKKKSFSVWRNGKVICFMKRTI